MTRYSIDNGNLTDQIARLLPLVVKYALYYDIARAWRSLTVVKPFEIVLSRKEGTIFFLNNLARFYLL